LPWQATGKPAAARLVLTTRERAAANRNYINAFVWKPALQQAAVPATRENGMHVLRHYFASALLEDGVSIKALAEYLDMPTRASHCGPT
jgi:site-specific recombinase XerD